MTLDALDRTCLASVGLLAGSYWAMLAAALADVPAWVQSLGTTGATLSVGIFVGATVAAQGLGHEQFFGPRWPHMDRAAKPPMYFAVGAGCVFLAWAATIPLLPLPFHQSVFGSGTVLVCSSTNVIFGTWIDSSGPSQAVTEGDGA